MLLKGGGCKHNRQHKSHLSFMPKKTNIASVPKTTIQFRTNEELKAELLRALRQHPAFDGDMTAFLTACATSFVVEMRAGRVPAFPLEFLPKGRK